ncbi:MAG: ParA family protein [Actinomycetes bacterium]
MTTEPDAPAGFTSVNSGGAVRGGGRARDSHIIAALSLKGGVGKTSVVLGLAGTAAERGLRVLVVDLDPQANSTSSLDPLRTPYTTSDVLYDGREGVAADAIVSSGWGPNVKIIPSERALEHRARPVGPDSVFRLRRSLTGVADRFDIVLIDCPPSLGELTRNALHAADSALVVTEPSFFAVQGAEQALEAVSVVRENGNRGLQPAGIIANRVRPTLTEHIYRMDEMRAAFGDLVLGGLPDRAAVQQAQGACVPVQRWSSNGAADICRAFDTLFRQVHVGRVFASTDLPQTVSLRQSHMVHEPSARAQ